MRTIIIFLFLGLAVTLPSVAGAATTRKLTIVAAEHAIIHENTAVGFSADLITVSACQRLSRSAVTCFESWEGGFEGPEPYSGAHLKTAVTAILCPRHTFVVAGNGAMNCRQARWLANSNPEID